MLQRAPDLVEAFEQAVADERVDLERDERPAGSTIVSALEVDRQLAAVADRAAMSVFTSTAGSVTGTRPILTEFEKKMSPNDGAITTSKP